jgi:HD-like signal output (HDOD) protein
MPLIEHPDPVRLVPATTSAAYRSKALAGLSRLQPFSVILNRLLAMLAETDADYARLGEMIEKDTVIAGNILQLVNSAMYGRRGTVNSVRHALTLLGLEKVRNAALSMSITRIWNGAKMPPSWSMAQFNMHSSAVAILSDCMAQRVPVAYGEGAFIAGLLHDVGRLLIALSLPDEYEAIEAGEDDLSVLGFESPELSAEALRVWNLPQPIQAAVLHHRNPSADRGSEPGEIRLAHVVQAADMFVESEGSIRLFEPLGIDEHQVDALLKEFDQEREAMAKFFR